MSKKELLNETKEIMLSNSFNLVKNLMETKQEFRIIIWNYDDWSQELPDVIMENYPIHLALDISGSTMDNSKVIEDYIYLEASFDEGLPYFRTLRPNDIVAVLDLDGKPYIVNSFHLPDENETVSKNELLQSIVSFGVSEDNAKRSLNAFMKG